MRIIATGKNVSKAPFSPPGMKMIFKKLIPAFWRKYFRVNWRRVDSLSKFSSRGIPKSLSLILNLLNIQRMQ